MSPGKQGVSNIRRISVRKGGEWIQTNTYILTFNQPHTPTEVKIGYCLERVEQYVHALLRSFKCQKYVYHREACRGRHTCTKCGEKDHDYMEEDCLREFRCANNRQDHPAYARSCDTYKKEKEIFEVRHKRNVSFPEARKIVKSFMRESSYTSVARRADTTNQDKYRFFVEKLIRLEPNDWPEFQEL